MKRKIWIILILLLAITGCLTILLKSGNDILSQTIKTVTVEKGDFTKIYKSTATVTSQSHHHFYNGSITKLSCEKGDEVEEGTVLLEYLDIYNHKQVLKSETKGFVSDINSGCVTVNDDYYVIEALLDYDRFQLVKEGMNGIFNSGDQEILCTVISKNTYGVETGNRILYRVTLKPEDIGKLFYGQKGNLTFDLMTEHEVLIVDKQAVIEKEDGFYLLPATWLNILNDINGQLLRIEVLDSNDSVVKINAAGVENIEVCLIDTYLKGFLDND